MTRREWWRTLNERWWAVSRIIENSIGEDRLKKANRYRQKRKYDVVHVMKHAYNSTPYSVELHQQPGWGTMCRLIQFYDWGFE